MPKRGTTTVITVKFIAGTDDFIRTIQLVNKMIAYTIGAFIEKVVSKELGDEKEKLEQEYKECYSNPRMLKEAKQWEKAGIESWLNYEENKNKKAK